MNSHDLTSVIEALPDYPDSALIHLNPEETLETPRISAEALESSVTLPNLLAFNDAQRDANTLIQQLSHSSESSDSAKLSTVRITVRTYSSVVFNLLGGQSVLNAPKPEEKEGIEFRRWAICTRHLALAA